jgi:hypothetical protein
MTSEFRPRQTCGSLLSQIFFLEFKKGGNALHFGFSASMKAWRNCLTASGGMLLIVTVMEPPIVGLMEPL